MCDRQTFLLLQWKRVQHFKALPVIEQRKVRICWAEIVCLLYHADEVQEGKDSRSWMVAFRLTNFLLDVRGNILYQSCLCVHFISFKVATCATLILDDYYLKHIPQALTTLSPLLESLRYDDGDGNMSKRLIIEHKKCTLECSELLTVIFPDTPRKAHLSGSVDNVNVKQQNLSISVCFRGWTFKLFLFDNLVQSWKGKFIDDLKLKN